MGDEDTRVVHAWREARGVVSHSDVGAAPSRHRTAGRALGEPGGVAAGDPGQVTDLVRPQLYGVHDAIAILVTSHLGDDPGIHDSSPAQGNNDASLPSLAGGGEAGLGPCRTAGRGPVAIIIVVMAEVGEVRNAVRRGKEAVGRHPTIDRNRAAQVAGRSNAQGAPESGSFAIRAVNVEGLNSRLAPTVQKALDLAPVVAQAVVIVVGDQHHIPIARSQGIAEARAIGVIAGVAQAQGAQGLLYVGVADGELAVVGIDQDAGHAERALIAVGGRGRRLAVAIARSNSWSCRQKHLHLTGHGGPPGLHIVDGEVDRAGARVAQSEALAGAATLGQRGREGPRCYLRSQDDAGNGQVVVAAGLRVAAGVGADFDVEGASDVGVPDDAGAIARAAVIVRDNLCGAVGAIEVHHRIGVGPQVIRLQEVAVAHSGGELDPVHVGGRVEVVGLGRAVYREGAGLSAGVVRLVGVRANRRRTQMDAAPAVAVVLCAALGEQAGRSQRTTASPAVGLVQRLALHVVAQLGQGVTRVTLPGRSSQASDVGRRGRCAPEAGAAVGQVDAVAGAVGGGVHAIRRDHVRFIDGGAGITAAGGVVRPETGEGLQAVEWRCAVLVPKRGSHGHGAVAIGRDAYAVARVGVPEAVHGPLTRLAKTVKGEELQPVAKVVGTGATTRVTINRQPKVAAGGRGVDDGLGGQD